MSQLDDNKAPVTAEELIKAQPLNPYTPLVFSKLSNKEPLAAKVPASASDEASFVPPKPVK